MKVDSSRTNSHIAYLSSYPPRECGIATFTQDLTTAIDKKFNPAVKSKIIAINDSPTAIYNYDKKVVDNITSVELPSYVNLAKKINSRRDIKLVNIQHEFGLFGGEWGDYIIPFLQVIEKPVITTFHSILPNPDDHLKNVVSFIANKSKTVVVMNRLSQWTLETEYKIPKSKITMIPHGIPQTTFEPTSKFKEEFGLGNNIVLSTFGLLSQNKGIEYAIRGVSKVVNQFPNVIYLILGITHPVIRKQEGESYRNFLTSEVEKLGLKDNVKFYNKYLTLEEIVNYLKATDIYLSPSIDEQQSVSGTLSYALGCGCPIVSTETTYATYIIKKRNGILVKPKNADAIGNALSSLLKDPKLIKSMSASAYEDSRHMIWPNVAASYFKTYQKYTNLLPEEKKFPEIKFDHLIRLTDEFGVFHFAKYSTPDKRYGYSLDDNARALIACVDYYAIHPNEKLVNLMKIYLNFIRFTQRKNGSFSNIVSYKKEKDLSKDEDVQGRSLWALGYVASMDRIPKEISEEAKEMFKKALRVLPSIKSPRATAFTMTGLYFYLKKFPNKRLMGIFKKFADQQMKSYETRESEDWQWFENHLTYSNSKLSESLFYAYDLLKNKKYLEVAEKTLEFLKNITFKKDYYSPIGQNGWYFRDKKRSYFDQQPEDAASMTQTEIIAHKITKKPHYFEDATKAFQWFLGKNHINQMVYDESTGGCHDGIGEHSLNLNEGAESTISYLMARLSFEDLKIKI